MCRAVGMETGQYNKYTCHYLCDVTTGAIEIKVITKTPMNGDDSAICDIIMK